MEANDLSQAFLSLEQKILSLLKEREGFAGQIDQLKAENKKLEDKIALLTHTLNNFQNQSKISKIVEHVAVGDNTAELKKKINTYIKEIDKCIAQLSQ